ncbi:MAG: hypothetical protein NT062_05375 [Proteobacteria bacterium]|nr:hypothetical protein [Pseudomonadota bacterium]
MHRYILLSLALAACVPDSGDEGILILKNVAPGDNCAVDPATSEVGITHGELSSVIPTQYQFIAQMKSKITALEGQEDQRTVFATGANVDLTFPDSTLFDAATLTRLKDTGVTHFRTLFAASIAPNGGLADAGFEVTTRALYDEIYAVAPDAKVANGTRFALEVVATITVTGTMGGDAVASQPYAFPIRIANDTLLTSVGACPLPMGTTVTYGNTCNRPQDAPISCCSTANGLMCPPTVVP